MYPLGLHTTLGPYQGISWKASGPRNLALTCSNDVCRHHIDRVKKLITEPGNPNLIISAAEDSSGAALPSPLSLSMQTDLTAPGRTGGVAIIWAGLNTPCCTIRGFSWAVLPNVLRAGDAAVPDEQQRKVWR